MKRIFLVFLLNFSLLFPAKSEVNFKGYFQNWFSISPVQNYENTEIQYGFSNRRVRFSPYGGWGDKVKWGIQFAYDKFSAPTVLEAWLEYSLSSAAVLKLGKFPAPGSRSGALISSAALDLIERPCIAQFWGGNSGLHSYRAFGAQFSGKLIERKLYYALMLGNALTASNNWMPSVKTISSENSHNGFGFWGRMEVYPVPGLDVGGFFGSSSEADPLIAGGQIKKNSFGGHIFYKKKGVNLKLEYIEGEAGGKKYSGLYSVAGYRLNKFEPVIGFEVLKPMSNGEKYTHTTAGINYYTSPVIRIQLNYVIRKESVNFIDNNILYANVQYSFDTKKK